MKLLIMVLKCPWLHL